MSSGCPWAVVPLAVMVMVLPSAATTAVFTEVTLPPFVKVVSVVVGLRRLRVAVSALGFPVIGTGLPS